MVNYKRICSSLLKDLPSRTREVIVRRFGLKGNKETLEAIGRDFNITRERVRQIEDAGLNSIKPKLKGYQKIAQEFNNSLKELGSLKKEQEFLNILGGENYQNESSFLLNLFSGFERIGETNELHSFWTVDKKKIPLAKQAVKSVLSLFNKEKIPYNLDKLFKACKKPLTKQTFISYVGLSKDILQGPSGDFGLRSWPEINPRGLKDKAYIVMKRENNPLHFRKITDLIGDNALSATVHNELIKSPKFVLVGRGTYALSEWGYEQGTVKDVISRILQQTQKPLSKDEIISRVLKQRLVKKNTVLLNLHSSQEFFRNSKGKYQIKQA